MCINPGVIACLLLSFLLVSCSTTNNPPAPVWQHPGQGVANNNNGYKTIHYDNGAKWTGPTRNGLKHGQGTMVWPNGEKYVGEARGGKRTGLGVYTWPSGAKYTGGFKDQKFSGYGIMVRADGEKYAGEYADNKKNGHGTITLPSGLKAIGEFKDDKSHGKFNVIRPDGRIEVQVWQMGKKISFKDVTRQQSSASSAKPNPARLPSGHLWKKLN